ncbi:MAG: hypothetical protein ACKVT0_11285 [Planctomycetaceae bacterium]
MQLIILLSGKGAGVAEPSTVMLWGGQTETEEVLRAVLEPRGYKISRFSPKGTGEYSSDFNPSNGENDISPPQLLVVDHDDATVPPCDRWSGVPRIIIGKMKSRPAEGLAGTRHKLFSHPFEYGELIHAIESML